MIDLSPILNIGIEILAIVLMVVASWAVTALARRLGVEAQGELASIAQDAVQHAVAFAVRMARERGDDTAKLAVQSEVLREAVGYVIESVPKTLERLGIDPDTVEGRARIEKMVRARLVGPDKPA